MNDLESLYKRFIRYLKKERGYSKWTVTSYKDGLDFFLSWCRVLELSLAVQITKDVLENYRLYILGYRKSSGEKLCTATINTRISRLRSFFSWLNKKNYILYNPAESLKLLKKERRLPRYILTKDEADIVMRAPNIDRPLGIRDRAILEVFYSTGIRKSELLNLKVYHIDFNKQTVIVRKGKYSKDRIIPIGGRALYWVKKYLDFVRPSLIKTIDENHLFLDSYGRAINRNLLGALVFNYIKNAGIGKKGACHIFRHSMATHMLEGGADVRYVQQMLGHAHIETTQIYTHVSIGKLKEVHERTMPSKVEFARLKGKNNIDSKKIYERKTINNNTSLVDELLKKPDKDSILYYLKKHLTSMKSKGLSEDTIRKRKYNLWYFIRWAEYINIKKLNQITREVIENYQHYIYDYKIKSSGKSLATRSKTERLKNVYLFFKYLTEKNYILYNPAEAMESPVVYKHLPGSVLTDEEALKILSLPDISEPLGLRDRAMLEVLYSCGLRRKEVTNIKIDHLDLKEKTLFILDGKGKKDRLIPVGESALYFLSRYLKEVRDLLLQEGQNDYIFLSGQGKKLDDVYFGAIISNYVKKAGINKTGSCLLFRHSMATRMLENGADIRYIQQMLGHTELKTTELYTHVSIKKLKEVHERTHPAKLSRWLEE
jgi:integrase/recombinase XerD